MKMKNSLSLMLASMLALTLSANAEQKSVKIKQGYPVGKKIQQSTEINQKMKMEGPGGQPMNMNNKISMDMSMDVKKRNEDQTAVVISYDKADMLIDAGIFKQEFSSDSDDGNPFTAIAGKSITMILDKDNQVVEVEGVENLLGDEAEDLGPMAGIKQLFSSDQLKQTIQQGLLQNVPDKELKVGDSWPYTMEMPAPQGEGKIAVKGSYTLKKFAEFDGHPCAVLSTKGDMTIDMEIAGGGKMKVEDSDFTGEIYFDNKLGLPRKSDLLTKMAMSMDAGGQQMKMNMDMTVIQKITKVEDSKK